MAPNLGRSKCSCSLRTVDLGDTGRPGKTSQTAPRGGHRGDGLKGRLGAANLASGLLVVLAVQTQGPRWGRGGAGWDEWSGPLHRRSGLSSCTALVAVNAE